MKKPILISIAISVLLAATATIICYITEAHKNITRLSEAGFYSVVFFLALTVFSAIIVPSAILIYKLRENLKEQTEISKRKLNEIKYQTDVLEGILSSLPKGSLILTGLHMNKPKDNASDDSLILRAINET